MALILCPECGKQFSDKAAACPSCGCPTSAIIGTAVSQSSSAAEAQMLSLVDQTLEALRKAEGDFRITGDGVLTKYLGDDTNVVIPDGVREIGESAFVDMKGVERMIMECEDYDAPAMKTLVIPDSVQAIGENAFDNCPEDLVILCGPIIIFW